MTREKIVQLETMLDHLSGEEIGNALECLNDMPEVLDAIFLDGIGKKNRPCGLLQVLCRLAAEEKVVEAIFTHTHSLGIRRLEIERYVAPRFETSLRLANEEIAAKTYQLGAEQFLRPEADALRELAKKKGTGMPAFRFRKNDEKG